MSSRILKVDPGVMESIFSFLLLGLEPGSFSEKIISGDYQEAEARAHPALKGDTNSAGEYTVIRDMIDFTNTFIPHYIIDDYKGWIRKGGFKNAPIEDKIMIKMSLVKCELFDHYLEKWGDLVGWDNV